MEEFKGRQVLSAAMGDPQTQVTGIAAVETCQPGDLVFVDGKDFVAAVNTRKPSVVVTSPALQNLFEPKDGLCVLVAPNVPLAHALIKQKYAGRDFSQTGWTGVHPSAVIHETAKIDPTVVVEPRAVIGKNSFVGARSRIMAGAVIENDVTIGTDTVIHPCAVIGYGCRIGNHVSVGASSVIGSEGYGFAQDEKRRSYPIPQTGIVVIEDRVRVGAGNCIDRAAYQRTRIGAGTKLDNLCHVAHNVDIGEDCLLTAMLCIAGSSKVGNRVITSGQTGILDHVKICDDTVLLHRAGVTKDVEKPGAYAGTPLLPLNQYMRNSAVLKNAEDLKKRVSELEKIQD